MTENAPTTTAPTDAPTPAPNPAPSPAPSPTPGGGEPTPFDGPGAFKSWLDQAPDEYRTSPVIGRFNDFDSMAKSLLHAQSMVGADKLPIPKGPEDKASYEAIYKALGRPDTVEGYELKAPETGFSDLDKEFHQAMLPKVHELGLSQAQVDGLAQGFTEFMMGKAEGGEQARQQRAAQESATLDQEWGAAKAQKTDLAKQAANALGVEAAALDALESQVGYAAVMKMFASIGEKVGATPLKGGANESGRILTPDEAKRQIREVEQKLAKFATDPQAKIRPEYKQLTEERSGLYKLAYPEG